MVEVLMAIFVVGIGTLSILVLFPLGMQNSAQAIAHNQTALAAATAEALLEWRQVRVDRCVIGVGPGQENFQPPVNPELVAPGSMYEYLSQPPFFTGVQIGVFDGLLNLNKGEKEYQGPSPPVFVDPLGQAVMSSFRVGEAKAVGSPGIPRSAVSFAQSAKDARRWFTLDNDASFAPNGAPELVFGLVPRERQYSWAYVLKRPRFKEPRVAECTIVVFRRRPLIGPNDETVLTGPAAYQGRIFTRGETTASVLWTPSLALRPGFWIFDATALDQASAQNRGLVSPLFNGYFYQVVHVSDPVRVGSEIKQDFEISRPAKDHGYFGVLFNGIVHVIEKGAGQFPHVIEKGAGQSPM